MLFGKMSQHSDPEIRIMLVRSLYADENSTFDPGRLFSCY